MNKEDFLEVISTWNSIYLSNHLAYEIQKKESFEPEWKKRMLRVISVLYVTDEIKDTPVESMVNKAIRYAKNSDSSKIQEVHELLYTVEKFINEDTDN